MDNHSLSSGRLNAQEKWKKKNWGQDELRPCKGNATTELKSSARFASEVREEIVIAWRRTRADILGDAGGKRASDGLEGIKCHFLVPDGGQRTRCLNTWLECHVAGEAEARCTRASRPVLLLWRHG